MATVACSVPGLYSGYTDPEPAASTSTRIKEEIGWLKLAFGILAVVDVSLVAWFAQNYATAELGLTVGCAIATLLVTVALVWVNHAAIRRFEKLEKQ